MSEKHKQVDDLLDELFDMLELRTGEWPTIITRGVRDNEPHVGFISLEMYSVVAELYTIIQEKKD